MTWSESVDEALCFGWIDGVRRRMDDRTYSIRFTPRKPSSIWSAVNIAKMDQLQAAGRMTPAGLQAFAHRKAHKSAIYSHEQVAPAELPALQLREFQRHRKAWQFFEATPPSYKKSFAALGLIGQAAPNARGPICPTFGGLCGGRAGGSVGQEAVAVGCGA